MLIFILGQQINSHLPQVQQVLIRQTLTHPMKCERNYKIEENKEKERGIIQMIIIKTKMKNNLYSLLFLR